MDDILMTPLVWAELVIRKPVWRFWLRPKYRSLTSLIQRYGHKNGLMVETRSSHVLCYGPTEDAVSFFVLAKMAKPFRVRLSTRSISRRPTSTEYMCFVERLSTYK